jgi:nitrite reductase/ring-hydroxylating ferredoxin subunit
MGTWLSASLLDAWPGTVPRAEAASRRLVLAGLAAAVPAALAGSADWSELHEQQMRVLADRCSHLSGPLSEGDYRDGCLTCPWHGSTFRVSDGTVARGPATAPQPNFRTRIAGGTLQACLPGAG